MNSSSIADIGRFVDPKKVATHFHLREGDIVADLGSGSGFFIETLAGLVGQSGRVYACEIQKNLLEKIGDQVRKHGLTQVQPLWSDLEEVTGSKIPSDTVDAAIMVNTFFQFDDKETALKEVLRILRPGGKFFLIDWSESFGGLGPQTECVVIESTAMAMAESAGLVFERNFDAGDHHYGLALRKV